MPSLSDPAAVRAAFSAAILRFDRTRPIALLGHNDADGLASLALLARAFAAAGWATRTRIVGRGESPWSAEMRDELAGESIGGLVIADLGVRPAHPRPDAPTIVIDHHVPQDMPEGAVVISGHGETPEPTTSMLAFWCAGALADAEPWVWLAALGLVGDMGDEAAFPEFARAKAFGVTAMRDAVALVNARSPHGFRRRVRGASSAAERGGAEGGHRRRLAGRRRAPRRA